jgi:hypothetical protein
MTEKETPAAHDKDRTHNEAPSEGDTAESPESDRQHTQDAAEGDDTEQNNPVQNKKALGFRWKPKAFSLSSVLCNEAVLLGELRLINELCLSA